MGGQQPRDGETWSLLRFGGTFPDRTAMASSQSPGLQSPRDSIDSGSERGGISPYLVKHVVTSLSLFLSLSMSLSTVFSLQEL